MRWGVHFGSHTRSTSTLPISWMPASRLCTCSKISPLAGHACVVSVIVIFTHCLGHAGVESRIRPCLHAVNQPQVHKIQLHLGIEAIPQRSQNLGL